MSVQLPAMLTEKQAFDAMYEFLAQWFRRTRNDEIGSLLGSMSTLPDGFPADQGIWDDWLKAIEQARSGGVDTDLSLT